MNAGATLSRATVAVVLLGASCLAGCSEYMDRKDTIAFAAGDAQATNEATHIPDPWPVHSRNKDIAFSGNQVAGAVRRYECGKTRQWAGSGGAVTSGGGASVNINMGGPAAATKGPCD